ncbi:MAG: hypothetical protein WDO24_05835 [Pseudomonadota bacterium]
MAAVALWGACPTSAQNYTSSYQRHAAHAENFLPASLQGGCRLRQV